MSRDIVGTWKMKRRASFPTRQEWEDYSDTDESEVSDLVSRPDDSAIRNLLPRRFRKQPASDQPLTLDLSAATRLQLPVGGDSSINRTADQTAVQTPHGQDQLSVGPDRSTSESPSIASGRGPTTDLPSSRSDPDLIDLAKAAAAASSDSYPAGRQLETVHEKIDEDDHSDSATDYHTTAPGAAWNFYPRNTTAKHYIVGCFGISLLTLLLTCPLIVSAIVAPPLSLACSWYCLNWICLARWQHTQPSLNLYTVAGYAAVAECCGYFVASLLPGAADHWFKALIVGLTDFLLLTFFAPATETRNSVFFQRIFILVIFLTVTRNVACSVIFLPASLAPFLPYLVGVLVGGSEFSPSRRLMAFDEVSLNDVSSQRGRRRSALSSTSSDRTLPGYSMVVQSSPAVGGGTSTVNGSGLSTINGSGNRGRRTSLPALSATNLHRHRHSSGSMPSYEAAVIAEAHGIITDMLANGTLLPPHIISGLRAVAGLLEQPGITTPSSANSVTRFRNGPFVSLSEMCSDTEESPYTGERPNVLSKRFRRSLPLSVLRRMSTSTWTTTTSATGLPTLEPEPVRKRSTSFRQTPVTSPGGSRSNSPSPACSPGYRSEATPQTPTTPKQRSFSTIIPSCGSPLNVRRYNRERQTIGSINIPDILFSKSVKFNLDPAQPETETVESEEGRIAHHLSPAIRRINLTSDYESSESPSNSEYGENAALLDDSSASTCVNSDGGGGSGSGGGGGGSGGSGGSASSVSSVVVAGQENVHRHPTGSRKFFVDDIVYDLDVLEDHALLNQLSDWDFPIFDLYNDMGDRILSQVAYKIFSDVGLFETFKIPTQEFLNYFHTLELGYRDKPYHNRIHAADVLHGVYYLSSQPIPGFVQVAWQDTLDTPTSGGQTLPPSGQSPPPQGQTLPPQGQTLPNLKMHYENANGEDDLYGIMGCNLPPLELMALYTAAAMHDYDHPGRTNAFLVATNAPQAILYNDRSVLENHHAAEAWRLLLSRPEFNWLFNLEKSEFKRFRYLVIEAILATDLKRHFEIIAEFNSKANDDDAPGLDWTNETDRLMASQMCIKLADINGPCKRKDLHLQWTYRITDEFFEQGDEEIALGLPISPYMDRKNSQLARLQESFINHLVAPLCNAYGESGMLPGRWKITEEFEDLSPNEMPNKLSVHTLENSFPEESVFPTENVPVSVPVSVSVPVPRIESLLTDHLKSNHEMWCAKVKEEERLKEERAEWDAKARTEAEVPTTS